MSKLMRLLVLMNVCFCLLRPRVFADGPPAAELGKLQDFTI